jgi:hypothetical protein
MLEGLKGIDWGNLHHAYGAATDVPDLIRSLASDDADRRERALDTLFGSIWHQGNMYEATVYAVPFLIELLTYPEIQGKQGILELLGAMASGSGYHEVHQAFDYYRRQRGTPEFEAKLAQERATVKAAFEAVASGSHVYMDLLNDTQPEVRLYASDLLVPCAQQDQAVERALTSRFESEPEPVIKAALLSNLVHVSGLISPERLAFLLNLVRSEDESWAVQLQAAALILHYQPSIADEAFALFRRVKALPPDELEKLSYFGAREVIFTLKYALEAHPRLLMAQLIEWIDYPDLQVKQTVLFAIVDLCSVYRWAANIAAPILAERLENAHDEFRLQLAANLSHLGSAAKVARPGLKRAARDPNEVTRNWAKEALAKIQGQVKPYALEKWLKYDRFRGSLIELTERLESLLTSRKGTDQVLMQAIIMTIGSQRRRAHSAVPVLEKALDAELHWVRVHAARALWAIDPHNAAQRILPTLFEELQPRPAGLLVIDCLSQMGSAARPAVPKLREIASSERRFSHDIELDEALQATAQRALSRIE